MGCTSNKHQKQNISTNHDNFMYAQWVKNRLLLAFKKTIDFHDGFSNFNSKKQDNYR